MEKYIDPKLKDAIENLIKSIEKNHPIIDISNSDEEELYLNMHKLKSLIYEDYLI